ncbi:helix-turn-helix domain-containing protein [Streptomyces sp. NRRL F-5630]|uniref:helix-turn-helix domain-containing protein n=1 Tax=Streptomyces sp. NRRL F-5630 TaxID=1463864 RepID=UPI0004CBAE40|nr:helix-turn-helix domain-containing protein [Streptomyces sp. NRRL F-5630]
MAPAPPRHRTVARVDRILEVVARNHRLTLSQIAHATQAPVSSTKDLLDELTACGYLVCRAKRYEPGPRPFVLGLVGEWASPAGIDHAELARLSEAARAPLLLAVLAGTQVYYLDHAGPRAPKRLQDPVDQHQPRTVLRTAAGRLLLALGAPLASNVLVGLKDSDPAGFASFEQELPAIRRARLARSDGLADPDIRAIAVPVQVGDHVPAAVVVTGRRRGTNDRSLALDAATRRLATAMRARNEGAT